MTDPELFNGAIGALLVAGAGIGLILAGIFLKLMKRL